MSGGHFDGKQHAITDIADEVERPSVLVVGKLLEAETHRKLLGFNRFTVNVL